MACLQRYPTGPLHWLAKLTCLLSRAHDSTGDKAFWVSFVPNQLISNVRFSLKAAWQYQSSRFVYVVALLLITKIHSKRRGYECQLEGNRRELGYALDKHTLSSTFLSYNEYGRAQWDTIRSEAEQALFRLKYRDDYSEIEALAKAIVDEIVTPHFPKIGFVVPMPASKQRDVQPVTKLAERVAELGFGE